MVEHWRRAQSQPTGGLDILRAVDRNS
jgi:hypothetical protein